MNTFHNGMKIKSERCKNLQQIYYCNFVGISLFNKAFYFHVLIKKINRFLKFHNIYVLVKTYINIAESSN